MSTLDSFDGPANKDFGITYYIASGFVLLCITSLLLRFTTNIQQILGHMADAIRHIFSNDLSFWNFVPMVHFMERNKAARTHWTMIYEWEY